MRSAMKLLLSAVPITIRPTLEIQYFARSVKYLVSNRAHSIPMHSQFLWRTGNYSITELEPDSK